MASLPPQPWFHQAAFTYNIPASVNTLLQIVLNCESLPGTTVSRVPDPKVIFQPEPEEAL